MATRLSFRCDPDLVERVNALRGQIPRERWLRDQVVLACQSWEARGVPSVVPGVAVEQASSEAKEPPITEQADPGSVSSPEDVRSAAPAEQPKPSTEYRTFSPLGPPGRARRSDEAKRGVQPIVKGGKQ